MKKIKQIFATVVALVMVLGIMAPYMAKSDAAEHKTNVHITKIKFDSSVEAKKHDAGIKTLEELKKLHGKTAEGLKDVKFTYWKVEDDQLKTLKDDTSGKNATVDGVQQLISGIGSGTQTDATDGNGYVKIPNLDNGNYWFVESERPKEVSSAVAVPFALQLPITNLKGIGLNGQKDDTKLGGEGYMTDVYLYPKNVASKEPEPKKTVGDLKNKEMTSEILKDVDWFLQATVPSNIGDYKTFKFTDNLDTKLTYKKDSLEVVYAAPNADSTGYDDTKKVILQKGSDYTITEPNTDKGGLLEINLTKDGIKKLADNYGNIGANGSVYVKFTTKINESAILGKPIENTFELNFNNGGGNEKTKNPPPSENPKVKTGGKKFIKIDKTENDKTLKGAKFKVKKVTDGKTYYLKSEADGKTPLEWTENEAEGKEFETNNEGSFELKGLDYSESKDKNGNIVKNKYSLIETKAPDGYAKRDDEILFEINDTSYYKDPVSLNDNTKPSDNPQNIENKKVTIPQTGGIGTVIFAVAGITLMGFAAYKMKKSTKED